MLRRAILALSFLTALLTGSVFAAEAVANRQFNDHDVVFDYPADWNVSVTQTKGGPTVSVEGPGDSIAMLSILKEGIDLSVEKYSSTCIENISSAMPAKAKFRRTGESVQPGMVSVSYLTTFKGTESSTTVNVSKHTLGRHIVFCITQVADKDRPKVQKDFDKIRHTLAAAK